MLFGNILNLDRGIFLPLEERPVSIRPLSLYASEMLAMQTNFLEKSAAELLRTDLLHMSTKEFITHKDYPLGSFVSVNYRTGAPPSRLHTYWRGPMRVVCDKQRYYLDLAKSRGRIGSIASQQCLYQLSILCK